MPTPKMQNFLTPVLALSLSVMAACAKPEKEAEPVVSVQVAQVKQAQIENVIASEAVLFPLQQAATSRCAACALGRDVQTQNVPVQRDSAGIGLRSQLLIQVAATPLEDG